MNAPLSGRLSLAFGVTPAKPHGYWPMSSERASTVTVTVRLWRPGLVSLSPNSAPRTPSGTKSVRCSSMPSIDGSL